MLARPKIQVAKPYKAAVWPSPLPPGGMVLWYFESAAAGSIDSQDTPPSSSLPAQKHRSMHEFTNVKMYTTANQVRLYFIPEPPTVPMEGRKASVMQSPGPVYESLQLRQAWATGGPGEEEQGLPSRGQAFRLLKPLFKRCRQGCMESSLAYSSTCRLLDDSSMMRQA